jgi:hypothetical protein
MTTIALSGSLIRFFNFAPKICMQRSWKTEEEGKKHGDLELACSKPLVFPIGNF